SGLGGDLSIDGYRSDNNIGKAGNNFTNYSMTVFIIVDQQFNISSHVGIPVNGVIGYHFFKNHPISVDYVAKKITIYNDESLFKKKVREVHELSITIEKNTPYIYGDVQMTNEKK